jgi:DNA modification methylase
VVAIFREVLAGRSRTVLDPFAGVGTIHDLRPDHETIGIELEPEWAEARDGTICGDARDVAALVGRTVDAIVTSPAYGNRLADAYDAYDPEARRSYSIDLGRPLTDGNGAGMHFGRGGEYEDLHRAVWAACVALLPPGGLFILNCKDFVRDGAVVPVTGWHLGVLASLGLTAIDVRCLPAAGLAMTTATKLSELVLVLRRNP